MGSFNIHAGGSWRPAKSVHVRDGAWRTAKEVWLRSGGVWRQAWSAFTAHASPSGMYGSAFARGGKPAIATASTSIIASPSDGVTYSWSHQSSGGPSATFTSSGANCTVRYGSTSYSTAWGTMTCVVSRAGASLTIVIPYELFIDSDYIGPDI